MIESAKRTAEVILLAEDEEDDVVFMRHALKQARIGCAFHWVEDGEQAIAYLAGVGAYADRRKCPLPDVFFLDAKMPKASGFEVLRWLGQKTGKLAEISIVMLSSSDQAIDREKADALGAQAYLVKPPSPEMLEDLAATLHFKWRRPKLPQATGVDLAV